MRTVYRGLLWLHPPAFRREFAGEMLWIFDQEAGSKSGAALFLDGVGSLGRQWLLRSGWWKIALALSLAVLQIILGGLAAVLFGPHQVVARPAVPEITSLAQFSLHGPIARQPLTIGIVMYLAVFLTAGIVIMVLGLAFWMKNLRAMRLRSLQRAR